MDFAERLARRLAKSGDATVHVTRRGLLGKGAALVAALGGSTLISDDASAAGWYYTKLVRYNAPCRWSPNPSAGVVGYLQGCGGQLYGKDVAGVDPGYFNCTEQTNIWFQTQFVVSGLPQTCYVHRGSVDPTSPWSGLCC